MEDVGRARDDAQEVDEVHLEEGVGVRIRLDGGGQEVAGPFARRTPRALPAERAARAALAPRLAVEVPQQALRAQGHEEVHHRAQRRTQVRALPYFLEPLGLQVLVPPLPHHVDERALDLLVAHELLRQLEHRYRAAEMAGVELRDGGVHQLPEALARLQRVLGQGHDLPHGLDLEARARRGRAGRGGQGAPAGQAFRQPDDHLVHRGVDPELPQGRQVLVQLLLVLRLHGGRGHELGGHFRALLGQGHRHALRLEPVQEEAQLAQAGGELVREPLGHRSRRRSRPRPPPRWRWKAGAGSRRGPRPRSEAPGPGSRGSGAGPRGPRRQNARMASPSSLTRAFRASARNEVELADARHLLDGVEEQVGVGDARHRGHLLAGPGPDLRCEQGRGLLQQQVHRIGEHERSDAVGEVEVQLLHRFVKLRALRHVASAGRERPMAPPCCCAARRHCPP
jgi:hypothetical protein